MNSLKYLFAVSLIPAFNKCPCSALVAFLTDFYNWCIAKGKFTADAVTKEAFIGHEMYQDNIANLDAAKVWSSPVIGDDGKVYLQFTNNDAAKKREFGAIVCFTVPQCSGPANSDWPMIGQNRRHTNCEK